MDPVGTVTCWFLSSGGGRLKVKVWQEKRKKIKHIKLAETQGRKRIKYIK